MFFRSAMNTARLEAFSDGVLAIIITITVLEMRAPIDAGLSSLISIVPLLFVYAWSFQTIGTYWNNHHHLLHATKNVSPGIMWANLHLLFWLSLIPFATEWLGTHFGSAWPTALYCALLFFSAIAYTLLERAIIAHQGKDSHLAKALGNDLKGKISLAGYLLSVAGAFFFPVLSYLLVVLIA